MLWDHMVDFGWMWWLIPIIPAHERQSQKDCIEFKTNLGYAEFQDSQDHYEFQTILGCNVRLYVKKKS